MDQRQHATIAAMHRLGLAFYPHMVWQDDILQDVDGNVGAEVNDYLMVVFNTNGTRTTYAYDVQYDELYVTAHHARGTTDE